MTVTPGKACRRRTPWVSGKTEGPERTLAVLGEESGALRMEDRSCDSTSPTESQVPGPLGELSRLLPDYLTSTYWHCPRC